MCQLVELGRRDPAQPPRRATADAVPPASSTCRPTTVDVDGSASVWMRTTVPASRDPIATRRSRRGGGAGTNDSTTSRPSSAMHVGRTAEHGRLRGTIGEVRDQVPRREHDVVAARLARSTDRRRHPGSAVSPSRFSSSSPASSSFASSSGQHRRRRVDPGDVPTRRREGDGEGAGADPELEQASSTRRHQRVGDRPRDLVSRVPPVVDLGERLAVLVDHVRSLTQR